MTIKSLQIERSESRRHVLFVVVLIAIELFAVIETAMAFAAMPTFMRVFEADATAVGWTSTAYLLVGAGSAATSGRLGDIFGRQKVLTLVLVGAVIGSIVSALAVDLWMIVLGRGLQGLSAGAIAISTGLIRELLPERRVPVAVALLGGIIPIASGIGALVAGVLLDQSGWRLMFAAAVVLGTAAALLSQFCIPATPGITPRPSVDLVGAIMLVPATAGVLFGITKGGQWGWLDWRVLSPILLGLVALAAWIWWERRVPEPIVDMRQFRNRKVSLTTLATIVVGVGPLGLLTLLSPMIMQLPKETSIGHGLSPTAAGAIQLLICIVCYGGAWWSGRISTRVGARWSLVAACVLYIGGAGAWFLVSESLIGTVIALGAVLMGHNLSLPAVMNLIVEAVPADQTGAATGMNRVIMNVAVAAGTAFGSVILGIFTVSGSNLPSESALTVGFVAIIATSVVALALALLIGDRRSADRNAPMNAERGAAKAAV